MDLAEYLYVPSLPLAVVALTGAVRAEYPSAKTRTLVACSIAFGIALSMLFTTGHSIVDEVRAGVLYGLIASGSLHVINFSVDKVGSALVTRPMDRAFNGYSTMFASLGGDAAKPTATQADEPKEAA